MIDIIVIVEDRPEEQEMALEVVKQAAGAVEEISREENIPGCPMIGLKSLNGDGGTQIQFAANLKVAKEKIEFVQRLTGTARVGVITDLMFPLEKGGKEEPNGLGVIAECIGAKLPVVVCSDTDHHDVNWLKPVFPALARAHPAGNIPVILDKKDWEQAVTCLTGLW